MVDTLSEKGMDGRYPIGDRGNLNGRIHRTTHSGVLHLDVNPSPSEIYVLRVQDWISPDSGIRCIFRTLRGIPLSRFRMKTTPKK